MILGNSKLHHYQFHVSFVYCNPGISCVKLQRLIPKSEYGPGIKTEEVISSNDFLVLIREIKCSKLFANAINYNYVTHDVFLFFLVKVLMKYFIISRFDIFIRIKKYR